MTSYTIAQIHHNRHLKTWDKTFTVKGQQALAFQFKLLSNEGHLTVNFIISNIKRSLHHIFFLKTKEETLVIIHV